MRQVPHYLIIGNGRVARHFKHYFSLIKMPFDHWHRALPITTLNSFLLNATHLLILIKDQAIEEFISTSLSKKNHTFIHFSGSLVTELAYGAHPLMTFNDALYQLADYQNIPFIIDENAPLFENFMPGLTNPHFRLNSDLKKKYHALCVLGGNFSCFLWQKVFSTFENEFNIPASSCFPYFLQQNKNLISDWKIALTGPLVRKDLKTLKENKEALKNDPFQKIYESFVNCYQQINGE